MYTSVLRVNDSEEDEKKQKNTLSVTVERSLEAETLQKRPTRLSPTLSLSLLFLDARSASLRVALPCVARCAVEQGYIGDEVMIGHVTPLGALSAPNELISLSPMRVVHDSRVYTV